MTKFFACSCKEEDKQALQKELAEVMDDLGSTHSSFLSDIVYGFRWNLPNEAAGAITGMDCDMWACITFYVQHWDEESKKYKKAEEFYIQCDKLEFGLAR